MTYLAEESRPQELIFDLADLAWMLVRDTMQTAEAGEHTPGSWVKEGREHHMAHARDHLRYEPDSGDIAHAVTRLCMALWSQRNGVPGDNGPEGKGYK